MQINPKVRPSQPHPLQRMVAALSPYGSVVLAFDRSSGKITARVEQRLPGACGDDSDRHIGEDGASRSPMRR